MELNSIHSFFHQAYMPHGHCYLWQPHLLWTNVISDLVIAAAYFSIPVAIMIFAKKRPDVGRHWLFILFSSFILLCGITHLIGIYTVWHGAYGIHGISKLLTAIVSMITAVYLFRLIPSAVAIPTPSQFFGVRDKLSKLTTEQKQLKLQLIEHKTTEFMLNSLPISTLLLDKSDRIIKCNPQLLNELGYKDAKLMLGTKLSEHIQLEDPFCNLSSVLKQARHNQSQPVEQLCQVITKDGITLPMEMRLINTVFDGQEFTLAVFNNLSSYRKLKQQLDASHQRIERAINATEDGVWEWDITNDHVIYSPTLMKMIGKEHLKNPTYLDWYEHIHPDYREKVEAAIRIHFETQEKLQVEYLGRNKDGVYAWFLAVGNSQFDSNGNACIMSGALRYIQNSKQLESQIVEKTNILNCLFDGANQAIWLLKVEVDDDFTFLQYNQAACERTNVRSQDIINKRLSQLSGSVFPTAIAERIGNNYSLCCETKRPIEYVETLPFNDEERWYQTTLYPMLDKKGEVEKIVGTAIDITARKLAEQELEHNKVFLEQIINSAVCGLYLYDIKHKRNIRINQRYTDLLGYNIGDLKEITITDLVHPDDKSSMQKHLDEVVDEKAQKLIPIEYRVRHKNGSWIWCSAVDTIISRDDNNNPSILLGTFVDITEKAQLLLKLKASNENLEHFAFLASHDLQEPLRKIIAFTDSLSIRLTEHIQHDENAQFEMSRLIEAANRMRTMIQDLLKLSRLQSQKIKRVPTTLKSIIDDTKEQMSYSLEEHDVKISIDTPDNTLEVDPSLFVQVFQNLFANSLKFKTPDSLPVIHIHSEVRDNRIMIYYEDNGIGIKEQYWQSVFEPFKRLDNGNKYSGSGIGLAMCKEIVKLHDGDISCKSSENQGTTFLISLPRDRD
ncbi:PAS domain-containing protein [Pseudoalteromonas sp. T1lg23B]|uniref:PAS domain-containing protein n=1 Tax=Pseudoalteromonas sp. T1lg23B TaxID=2077097 RepID=UPI000CF61030|nr:PAS domain-containing protein [Pseudoalteromonas sp. T1lg23B]